MSARLTHLRFKRERAALEFAIRAQRNRRNLTEADIVRCIQALDQRKSHAEAGAQGGRGNEKQAPNGASFPGDSKPAPKLKSAMKTAELLGISPRQVERVRTVRRAQTGRGIAANFLGDFWVTHPLTESKTLDLRVP